ncbi:MAG: hypothetical protein IJE56_02300, partial [Clostridia bacterium]|nr:hypothetical protein [Clostridia bacterium]
MILENATRKDYRQIKRLFISAFPKEERPPFYALKRKLKTGEAKMYVAKDNGNFISFIHLVCYKDLIYLFFFAIYCTYIPIHFVVKSVLPSQDYMIYPQLLLLANFHNLMDNLLFY